MFPPSVVDRWVVRMCVGGPLTDAEREQYRADLESERRFLRSVPWVVVASALAGILLAIIIIAGGK